jgi:riboflavin synthase
MFSGLIETTGKVRAVRDRDGIREVAIAKPASWKLARGASIAADGICLTVTASSSRAFTAELMPETLRKTTGNEWAPKRVINLERPLTHGSRLDGHLVQGHVDARATVLDVTEDGASRIITLRLPRALAGAPALHGSIAVNGVSLTIARLRGTAVTLALIPYTLVHTNLGSVGKGDEVNIETDFLARHAQTRRGRVRAYAASGKRAKRRA